MKQAFPTMNPGMEIICRNCPDMAYESTLPPTMENIPTM